MTVNEIARRCVPIWDTTDVYAESLTFVRDGNGAAEAPLLYAPERVIRLTDAREEREYSEGVDFEVTPHGIRLTPGSSIFCFEKADLEPVDPAPGTYFPASDRNIFFTEGHFFHDRQVSVTYTAKENDWTGHRPRPSFDRLPRTKKLLTEDKKLRLLVFGDSLSVGANASGFADSYAPPYQPTYVDMLAAMLRERYGAEIVLHNPSKGGAGSAWAVETVNELAAPFKPDLAVVAFGGNDSPTPPEVYAGNIKKTAEAIRAANPDCEFIFAATLLPNTLLCTERALFYGNQPLFVPELYKLADEFGSAAVASISELHDYILTKKRFIDMTGNNVNHPNDFMHRLHAQYYLGMLS